MQQENTELATKGDINGMRADMKELKSFIMDGFEAMNLRFDSLEKRIDRIETSHNRRISTLEDRTRSIKDTLEEGLKVKVAW